jgi:hypothetical protein
MTKTFIVAALLSSFAAVSFAQGAASAPADGASAPVKHHHHRAHKAHKAASGASSPEASADKKGGQ